MIASGNLTALEFSDQPNLRISLRNKPSVLCSVVSAVTGCVANRIGAVEKAALSMGRRCWTSTAAAASAGFSYAFGRVRICDVCIDFERNELEVMCIYITENCIGIGQLTWYMDRRSMLVKFVGTIMSRFKLYSSFYI